MTHEECLVEHAAASERYADIVMKSEQADFTASIIRNRVCEFLRADLASTGEKVTEAKLDNLSRTAPEVENAHKAAAELHKERELARLSLVRIESAMRHLE